MTVSEPVLLWPIIPRRSTRFREKVTGESLWLSMGVSLIVSSSSLTSSKLSSSMLYTLCVRINNERVRMYDNICLRSWCVSYLLHVREMRRRKNSAYKGQRKVRLLHNVYVVSFNN